MYSVNIENPLLETSLDSSRDEHSDSWWSELNTAAADDRDNLSFPGNSRLVKIRGDSKRARRIAVKNRQIRARNEQ